MVEALCFRVLGPLAVGRDGATLRLRSPGQRALLAALLVAANQPVPHDELAEAVWERSPPARAEDVLRVHVSQLRKQLGKGLIVTVPGGYLLHVDPEQVDSHRFERGVRAGQSALRDGDDVAAEAALTDALALWHGEAYDELRYRAHFQPEIRRLDELRVQAREDHAECLLRLGRHDELLAELPELVEAHPHRERLWAQLMLALYRSGRQADALAAFRRAHRRLGEELGLEPGPELRRLEQQILLQEPALEPPQRTVRLPSPLTSFVGRRRELAEATAALASRRLVTLVGAGGIGKTRLAIETARGAAPRFADGVHFVDLVSAGEAETLAGAVWSAVDRRSAATSARDLDALLRELEPRQMLLVLDNCEHVVEQAAALVSRLLERCAGLSVLATSRERLGIPGELLYQVPSLGVPDEPETAGDVSGDAVALFLARARDAAADLPLDEETLPVVLGIVRALDGIPLAIELAASRISALSLDELAATVRAAMPELGAESRVALPRHATLRAAFAWSVALLRPAERELFARLWIFHGSWSLAALASLCGEEATDVLVPLVRLVDVSLVEVVRNGAGVRYRLLEPVRQYARTVAGSDGDAADLETAHVDVYTALALEARERFDRGDAQVLETYRADEANLVAALETALRTRRPEDAARIGWSLGTYWSHVGRYERADHWLGLALAAADGIPRAIHADLLVSAGRAASLAGQGESAERLLTHAERLLDDTDDDERKARLLNELGNMRALRGDMRAAAAAFEESQRAAGRAGLVEPARRWLSNLAAVYTWSGNATGAEPIISRVAAGEREREAGAATISEGMSLLLRGQAALYSGDPDAAEQLLATAVPIVATHGMRSHHALGLVWQGLAALAQDRPDRAAALAEEARAVAARSPGWTVRLFTPEILAWSARARGDGQTARAEATAALSTSREVDNPGGMARGLDLFARLEHDTGASDRAAVLLAASTAARQSLGHARAPHEARSAAALERSLEDGLGPARFAELRDQGAALPLRHAVELALADPVRLAR